jgi:hypothetical protein
MLRHLTGLNHTIFASRNLEAAKTAFEQLGFCLTPRGAHPSRGTANYCIMFSNAHYIELLGFSGELRGEAEPLLQEQLRCGEGIAAVAFDSDDGERLWHELEAVGVLATKPHVGERDFQVAGKPETVRFEILRLPAEATPGLRTFICRHLDPLVVYHAKFQKHDNTADRIKAVTMIVDDPMAMARPYETLLGKPEAAEGCLAYETGNGLLQFATAGWIAQYLWPGCTNQPGSPGCFVTVGVRDLGYAEKLAADGGFSIRPLGRRRLVENTDRTCGVGLIYEDMAS